jgi:glycosyltransferase involved in cell wall biosynthesis
VAVKYSVVAPMHNEQGNVRALYDDIKRVMEALVQSYEIIFVNDASTDQTLATMREIHASDAAFHFADLETNVGENWALLAGISKAKGEVIVTIDGDYQNDPAYIPDLLQELAKGRRVVSGRREQRAAPFWTKRLPSQVANTLIRLVSGVPVHDCGCGLKAYRREVLEGKFVPKGFMNRFSPVSLGVKGDEFSEVKIVDRARIAGQSHYGLGRVLVVLRDLWVLPFAARGPDRWLERFRVLFSVLFGVILMLTFWGRWVWIAPAFLLAAVSFFNLLNLKRFVEAQTEPKFHVREFR